MSPYRCSECTLFRCDAPDIACDECLPNKIASITIDFGDCAPGTVGNSWSAVGGQIAPPAAPTIGKTSKTLVFNYGMNPVPAAPQSAPPAAPRTTAPIAMPPGTYATIPGDNRHNAQVAASVLMTISWSDLKKYAIATGKPWHEISGVYRLLADFAASP